LDTCCDELQYDKFDQFTDALEALSGTARSYAVRYKKRYLAELWLEELPQGLLWASSKGLPPPTFIHGAFVLTGFKDRQHSKHWLLLWPSVVEAIIFVRLHGECVTDSLDPFGVLLLSSMYRGTTTKRNRSIEVAIRLTRF
jgi:hypothetical protein